MMKKGLPRAYNVLLAIFLKKERGEKDVKQWKIIILVCILCLMLPGCQKDEVPENKQSFYKKIIVLEQEIPKNSMSKVEKGIREWALTTLVTDDHFSQKDKKIIEEKLYSSIVSEKERKKIKKEREKFYKDAEITVKDAKVDIKSTKEGNYNNLKVGIVECVVDITGTRNKKSFKQHYELTLGMNYENEIATVYEIGKIELK